MQLGSLAIDPGSDSESPKEITLNRVVRVEIISPIDLSWPEFGSLLRQRRAIAHRLINAAIIGIHIESKRRLKEKDQKVKSLETLAYQFAMEELESFRNWAASSKDERIKSYAMIHVPAGMVAAWSKIAFSSWKKWSKSKGEDGFPTMRRNQPISIRSSNDEWSLQEEDGKLIITANLDSTRANLVGKRRMRVYPGHGTQWAVLRNIVSGANGFKKGDLKIVYDERARRKDGNKGKWYGLLSYSFPAPEKPSSLESDRVLVIHRGYHNLLFLMTNGLPTHTSNNYEGAVDKVASSGKKLASQKNRVKARRRSLQDALKRGELGSGSRGHGRKRRLKPITSLDNLEERIIHTTCQQAAAEAIKIALNTRCGRIFIGSYGGIEPDDDRNIRRFVPRAPLYELKLCVINAAQKAGIAVEEIDEAYVSQICPACGAQDPSFHNKRTGVFHCTQCGLNRLADWVSSFHMLRRTGCNMDLRNRRLEFVNRLAASVRKQKDNGVPLEKSNQ